MTKEKQNTIHLKMLNMTAVICTAKWLSKTQYTLKILSRTIQITKSKLESPQKILSFFIPPLPQYPINVCPQISFMVDYSLSVDI